MLPIVLTGFAGSASATNPRLLNEHVGTNVVDAEPGSGDLRPLHAALPVATVPSATQAQTIYRMGEDTPNDAQYWLSWPGIVNVVRSLDGSDTTERIYYTGDGTPKWTNNVIGLAGGAPYPQGVRELAVPAPLGAPLVSLTTDGTGTEGTRFYVSTFVDDIGWESAPSAASTGLTCKPGAVVAINALPPAPSGNYGITKRRIYRTQPGTADAAASFYFLREVAIGVTSTTDDARALGELLPTTGYLPPDAAAHSLIGLWNGMTAMLVGKTVAFSEPNLPYAVPVKYDQTIVNTPIALAKWEQNLLVLTNKAPVLFQGQEPSGMSETPFRVGFACRSARSVVGFEHGVVWASAEGLAYTGSEQLITHGIITPKQWKALKPETMIAGRWRSLYVWSYDDGGGRKGLMFDPLNPALGLWFLTTGFDACYYDALADELYVLVGGSIQKFDGGAAKLTATFKSKVFRQVAPRNFGFAKVVADSYPLTLKVWVDAGLRATKTVIDERPFRLPGGFKGTDWQVEVANDDSVEAVHLAASVGDLRV